MTGRLGRAGARSHRCCAARSSLALAALVALALAWLALDRRAHRLVPLPAAARDGVHGAADGRGAREEPGRELQYRWVPYARISVQLKRAMIAAEDAKFVDHAGFDWDGIQNALEKNQKQGRVVGGGSTITQQLAKNLFLSPAKSYWRKARGGGRSPCCSRRCCRSSGSSSSTST